LFKIMKNKLVKMKNESTKNRREIVGK